MLTVELRVNGVLTHALSLLNDSRHHAHTDGQYADYTVSVHDLRAATARTFKLEEFERSRGAMMLVLQALSDADLLARTERPEGER